MDPGRAPSRSLPLLPGGRPPRQAPHALGGARSGSSPRPRASRTPGSTAYGILANADLPWPTVKLSTGEVRLDPSGYGLARASPLRADREAVFAAFLGAFQAYSRTMGATLDGQVKAQVFQKKVRGFGSSLESSLFDSNIPPAVYRQLVADVRRSLPTFHRYLELRRRMLGLEKLRYQDLYVPMVGSVPLKFSPDEARAITLEAFAPLGAEYVDGDAEGVREPLDGLPALHRQGVRRLLHRRLRSAPVPAPQLQRAVR